jgi:hypothetical protein
MITSIQWIPRGCARHRPLRFEISPEEFNEISLKAK